MRPHQSLADVEPSALFAWPSICRSGGMRWVHSLTLQLPRNFIQRRLFHFWSCPLSSVTQIPSCDSWRTTWAYAMLRVTCSPTQPANYMCRSYMWAIRSRSPSEAKPNQTLPDNSQPRLVIPNGPLLTCVMLYFFRHSPPETLALSEAGTFDTWLIYFTHFP